MSRFGGWLGIVAVACGGADGAGGPISEDQAGDVWGAFLSVLTRASNGALLSAATHPDGVPDGTTSCLGGGAVHVTGTVTDGDPLLVDLALHFDGCVEGEVEMSGEVDYHAEIGDDTATFETTGSLDLSGSVEGACAVDLQQVVVDAGGAATTTFAGVLCGHPMDLVVSAGG